MADTPPRISGRWSRAALGAAAAWVVLQVGSTLGVLPLAGNLRFLSHVPWALPATLLVTWAFWRYACGSGPPGATRAYRAAMTRDQALPAPLWRAVAPAIGAALVASCSLRLLLPSVVAVAPPSLPIDPAAYPVPTVLGLAFALAVSSGVVEELAFRGYLQKSLEEAVGIVPALALTGVAFWWAHADKVTLSHLPFHLLVSVLLGTATYLTRSLIPAVVGHVLGDALLLPAYVYHQPAVAWSLLAARPVWEAQPPAAFVDRLGALLAAVRPELLLAPAAHPVAVAAWLLVASCAAAVLALRRLARVAAVTAARREPVARRGRGRALDDHRIIMQPLCEFMHTSTHHNGSGAPRAAEDRREALKRIIRDGEVGRQAELVRLLKRAGYPVTQSSVSRDLRDLGVAKVGDRYVLPEDAAAPVAGLAVVANFLQDAVPAGPHLTVVRTTVGSAQSVAIAIDRARWPEVVGTISGDDTIFIATASERAQRALLDRLRSLASR